MGKNKVNVTQISLLLLLVITGGKFLSLPSILAKDVGHDSWLVMGVAFMWDLLCLCFLLWGVKLNKNRLSIDAVLDKTVTKVGSKIVLFIFFVMFMCRTLVLLDSCYNTFAVTFDVNTNWILFMLPIVAVAGFAIYRGFNSIARVSQVLFALILLSIVAILIYPTTQAQFSYLLPIGEAGAGKIFGTAFMRSFWFSDYVFIYFVLEDIKPQKRVFTPVLTCFAVGVVLTLLLDAVFVALFGDFAQYGNIAMSKIGMFSVSESTDGRWDWITLTVWLTSVIIKVIIFIFCAYKCVEKIFGLHFVKINLPTLGALSLIMLIPMFLPTVTLVENFVHWCVIPFAVVQYVLPLLMPLLVKLAHKSPKTELISINGGIQ
ncbi:MAG: GerAB/ArcD/ProY family transporter [Corallococcus sp.]|nr:GerAB/ArcD/ProY family transporter [Corallococcus sp.]MCM1359016.1 GerAB/ArcD/ProY family transporter [Corallococcus sp.]MCM1395005.1 GerAB/ArcD/ProY family transporter [Corallococcus sp.]